MKIFYTGWIATVKIFMTNDKKTAQRDCIPIGIQSLCIAKERNRT